MDSIINKRTPRDEAVSLKDNSVLVMEKTLVNKTNQDVSFMEKKIEKLVSAIYIVTSYMDQSDVLVSPLRRVALCLFDTKRVDFMGHDFGKLSSSLETLASHIRIGQLSESISQMNGDILLSAILHLEQLIAHTTKPEQFVFSENFFEEVYKETLLETQQMPTISVITPASPVSSSLKNLNSHNKEISGKHFVSDTGVQRRIEQKISTGKKLDLALKLNRRNTLLRLIKEKGSVSIKECVSVTSDCSEKTIQRELNQLVEQKILKKTGDKRWSRYSLA